MQARSPEDPDPVPPVLLKTYLAYAREHVHPVLSDEARQATPRTPTKPDHHPRAWPDTLTSVHRRIGARAQGLPAVLLLRPVCGMHITAVFLRAPACRSQTQMVADAAAS